MFHDGSIENYYHFGCLIAGTIIMSQWSGWAQVLGAAGGEEELEYQLLGDMMEVE